MCLSCHRGTGYISGRYYHYTYDSVGNRLTEQTQAGTTNYVYDIANRLASVDGVSYTWGNNGNLLSDEVDTYAYTNNKLSSTGGGGLPSYLRFRCRARLASKIKRRPAVRRLPVFVLTRPYPPSQGRNFG